MKNNNKKKSKEKNIRKNRNNNINDNIGFLDDIQSMNEDFYGIKEPEEKVVKISKKRSMTVTDELQKVSNVKSVEQIKKPKKIVFMASFYVILSITVLIFLFIRFSKVSSIEILFDQKTETTEKISDSIVDDIEDETNNIDVTNNEDENFLEEHNEENTDIDIDTEDEKINANNNVIEETTEKDVEETTKKVTVKKMERTKITRKNETEKVSNKDTVNESIAKKIEEIEKSIKDKLTKETDDKENVEDTEEIKEETTSKKRKTSKANETSEKIEETKEKESTTEKKFEKEETTKKLVSPTTTAKIEMIDLTDILPKFLNTLYSYSNFFQYNLDELGSIYKYLEVHYERVKDRIFGEVELDEKATNGIVYLNFTNIKDYMIDYTESSMQGYDRLGKTAYCDYVKSTEGLEVSVDFQLAKNNGLYYEMPARFYEPGEKEPKIITLKILNKAKIGFSNSFSLTSMLQILDIEWNTKHNPYFDISEIIGTNPKYLETFTSDTFKIPEMLSHNKFNYVVYDKKGYVTDMFMLK